MITAESYRAAEPAWHPLAHAQAPVSFLRTGFPIRADDVASATDRMQVGRASRYLNELRCTWNEIALHQALQEVRRSELIDCFRLPPRDTLAAAYALYRKLAWRHAADVLEIGPGDGLLALFLARHAGLLSYHQIETTETLYRVQSAVNEVAFGPLHHEHAICGGTVPALTVGCHHWPWWRLDELGQLSFDVVVAAACLCEMSAEALDIYLRLIRYTLRSTGVLIVQCFGAEHCTPQVEVRRLIVSVAGLSELAFFPDGHPDFAVATAVYGDGGKLRDRAAVYGL